MITGQDEERFGIPALACQPTRRFWAEAEESKLEDGWKALNSRWDPPRSRGVDFEGTEGTLSGNDGTGVPEGIVEGS